MCVLNGCLSDAMETSPSCCVISDRFPHIWTYVVSLTNMRHPWGQSTDHFAKKYNYPNITNTQTAENTTINLNESPNVVREPCECRRPMRCRGWGRSDAGAMPGRRLERCQGGRGRRRTEVMFLGDGCGWRWMIKWSITKNKSYGFPTGTNWFQKMHDKIAHKKGNDRPMPKEKKIQLP